MPCDFLNDFLNYVYIYIIMCIRVAAFIQVKVYNQISLQTEIMQICNAHKRI